MTTRPLLPDIQGLLVIPGLRIQAANAISSSLTWGFPAITAFIGLMQALERRLGESVPITFDGVGVICHGHEVQASSDGFVHRFHLTRNPPKSDGTLAAIVEAGRIHLDITLVFGVNGDAVSADDAANDAVARRVADTIAQMRVAGGSVVPALPGHPTARRRPELRVLGSDAAERAQRFRRWCYRWLPGFALVSRDDFLQQRLAALQALDADATTLDAWLDASCRTFRAERQSVTHPDTGVSTETLEWNSSSAPGGIVPIPVGYGALSKLYAPGKVLRTRDPSVSTRFVESVYSLGQWVSPHRIHDARDLLWYSRYHPETSLYRCYNDYRSRPDTNPASETP